MTEARNATEIDAIISLFSNMNSSCKNLWTPITDEEVEGQFKSIITGDLATYIPWGAGQPDGGSEDSTVFLEFASKHYWDIKDNFQACVLCDLFKDKVFSLMGVCYKSIFGEFLTFP